MEQPENIAKWYVLYTAARAEKQVKLRLDGMGIETWVPLHRCPRVWSDRIKMVDVPLFSSYVFVHCAERELRNLINVYGVARVIFYNGKAAVVRDEEIEAIKQFLAQASELPLCPGDEVEIVCGMFKNVSGKIKKIKKSYLVLSLEQLGATVCVKLDTVVRLGGSKQEKKPAPQKKKYNIN